jgi:glycerophosphoryl diester phosphodiesterase
MASMLTTGAVAHGVTGIIAHRGASYDAPENTLASFRLAFEQGANAAELDLHLTADGRIIVHHDSDTMRSAGVARSVIAQTAAELRMFDVSQWGRWRGSSFKEKIPLLSEVLAIVPETRRLFIELKTGVEILPELARVISTSGMLSRQLAVMTFDLEVAHAAKRQLPAHEVCWISAYEPSRQTGRYPVVDGLIRQAAGLDGLNLHWEFPIDEALVRIVHAAGLKLYTWTVDDPVVAQRHQAAGVDGITTNRPAWLRAQLDTRPT